MITQLVNFFREDLSEIVGVYHDGEKIFLARLADKLETAEVDFSFGFEKDLSAAEQLAKKVAEVFSERGWKFSRIGLCLREGEATTNQVELKIPAEEIESAVKAWSVAHVGKDEVHASLKVGNEIWMESLPKTAVDEYVAAWRNNSMTLCALTAFPEILADDAENLTPVSRAIFVAKIIAGKKIPNLLLGQFDAWNWKKISAAAAAIFLFCVAVFSAKLGHDYFKASAQLETARESFAAHEEELALKEELDENIAAMKNLTELIASQADNSKKLNTLIKLGRIADGKIRLTKINASGDSMTLEGIAESSDAVQRYLRRLKSSVEMNARLERSTATDDDEIIFSVKITLSPNP